MVTAKDDLLMTVLRCGTLDLEMLESVRYDFGEIIGQLDGLPLQEAGFNGLMRAVVDVGIIHIQEALEEKLAELHGYQDEGVMTEGDKRELQALEQLDPDRDIHSYHNCLDTSVWFEKNGSAYRRYLTEAIDSFEENTDLYISGGEAE